MHFDQRPYFNMTIGACRRAGAIGGRRSARNRRLLNANRAPVAPETAEPSLETAAEAIALLDAQFPWLRGAERRDGQ